MILGRVKRALAWLLGGLGLLWGAWVLGRRDGKRTARADRAEGNVKAAQQAKDNRDELESQDDQHLVDILTGRLRDGKR